MAKFIKGEPKSLKTPANVPVPFAAPKPKHITPHAPVTGGSGYAIPHDKYGHPPLKKATYGTAGKGGNKKGFGVTPD